MNGESGAPGDGEPARGRDHDVAWSIDAADPDDAGAFDFDDLFDADYLAFYGRQVTEASSDEEAELIATLLDLQAGERVLDLPCGNGRIARRLAAEGAVVTGLDRCHLFLEQARADAMRHGIEVDYRHGDMRAIEFDGEFDIVVNWFTSFGYFDDDTLRDCLRRMWRALRPGGRLLLETMNLHESGLTADEATTCKELREKDQVDLMVDRSRYDPHDGRLYVRRLVARSGQPTRVMRYFMRLFSPAELRGWLHAAGFAEVRAFGGEGEVFRVDSNRLIVVAHRR